MWNMNYPFGEKKEVSWKRYFIFLNLKIITLFGITNDSKKLIRLKREYNG